jgi:hypothetical protein
MKRSKHFLMLAALTLVAAAVLPARSRRAAGDVIKPATYVDPMTACMNQYNSLVHQAKSSLTTGDRNGAIKMLLSAETQLGRCQEIENKSTAQVSVGLNAGGAFALEPPA